MKTIRTRTKKRGYHQNGYKLDGTTPSLDLCPCCLSFGCDPMSMSDKFNHKVRERMRKKCCPSCGEPKAFCRCKSDSGGTARMVTHNNKKLRAARKLVQDKETAMRYWDKNKDRLLTTFDEETYETILDDLWNHDVPTVAWNLVAPKLASCGLDLDILSPGWT